MSLINKKELQDQFLLENKYGVKSSSDQEAPWPHNTILLYDIKMYDAKNVSVLGKPPSGCAYNIKNAPTWCRLDNDSRSCKLENGDTKAVDAIHAEVKLVKQLITELNKMDPKPRKLDITLLESYSPCNDCAQVLIDFKQYVEGGMNIICNIKIKFSSFYNCHLSDKSNNLLGLCKLLKNSISLETLSGADDWNWVLKNVLSMSVDIESLIGLSDGRKEREAIDDEILHGIKFHMETDGRPEHVPLVIGNSASLNDAQSKVKGVKRDITGAVNAAANRLKKLNIDTNINADQSRSSNGIEEGKPIISICIPSVFATIDRLAKPSYKRKALKKDNGETNLQVQQDNTKAQRYNGHDENYGQRRGGNRGNGNNQSRYRQGRGYRYREQEQQEEHYGEVDNGQYMGYQQNNRYQHRSNRRPDFDYDYHYGYDEMC